MCFRERVLAVGPAGKARQKEVEDQVAATLILQASVPALRLSNASQ